MTRMTEEERNYSGFVGRRKGHVVSLNQCQSQFIGATELFPQCSCLLPLSAQLLLIRLRDRSRWGAQSACTPEPVTEFTQGPGIAVRQGQIVAHLRFHLAALRQLAQ